MLEIKVKRKIKCQIDELGPDDKWGIVKIFAKNSYQGQKNNDKLDRDFKLSELSLFVGAGKDSFSCEDCKTPNYSSLEKVRDEYEKIYKGYSHHEHGYYFRMILINRDILPTDEH